MKQMVNTTAPVQKRLRFCELYIGLFFRPRDGRIFFIATQHDKLPIWFPVLEDGTLHPKGVMKGSIDFFEQVEVIRGEDIGAKFEDGKVVWSKEEDAFVG